jgi:hypothetical protein
MGVGVNIRVFPCFLFVWCNYIGIIFYNFLECWVWLPLIVINLLSYMKLFILCLYYCVSITSVFSLSACVMVSSFVAILSFMLFPFFFVTLIILPFRLICFMFFLQLHAYNNFKKFVYESKSLITTPSRRMGEWLYRFTYS